MKTIKLCPACNSKSHSPAPHSLYRICDKCTAVFQHEGIETVDDYYASTATNPSYEKQKGNYHKYLKYTAKYIHADSTIIDVGAGDGTFLNLAKKNFPHVTIAAVETSPTARETIKKLGIPLEELQDVAKISPKTVYSFQVLEHVNDPNYFIKSLGIRSGDTLILTSPATDSKYFEKNAKHWRSYSPSHHLTLYNKRSLNSLLDNNGLKLLSYEYCYSGSSNHNSALNYYQFSKKIIIWCIRLLLKGYKTPPKYHGMNSFLACCTTKDNPTT